MQNIRWVFFAGALCISTWLSTIVHVNNLTVDLVSSPPCNNMLSDAPSLQNYSSQDTERNSILKEVSMVATSENETAGSESVVNVVDKIVSAPKALPPVHINSSWIGNQWIPPPGYRLYSTREIQSFFGQHSVLWVGDSTARRAYGTMYGILNATQDPDDVEIHDLDHPQVLDMNKMSLEMTVPYPESCHKSGYNLCRLIPTLTDGDGGDMLHSFDQVDATCLGSLVNMTENGSSQFWRDVSSYSLVIFSIGPWELRDRCGPDKGWQMRVEQFLNSLYRYAEDSNTTFIWRTWGSIDFDVERKAKMSWKKAYKYNEYFKQKITEHDEERRSQNKSLSAVTYIDWGQAMFPRSFPRSKRIRGDMQAHFGLEARLTFLQMLVNHMMERERQKRFQNSRLLVR